MHLPSAVEICWQRLATHRVTRVAELSVLAPWWNGLGIHRHRIPTMVVAIGGAVRLEFGPRSRLDLTPGEAVLVQPWIWHSHPVLTGGTALALGWSHRQGDLTVFWPGGSWEGAAPRDLLAGRIAAIVAAVPERRCAGCAALIAELANDPPKPSTMPLPAQAMAHYLWQHRSRPITVASLLGASGLGPTAANRMFRQWFGASPKQHLLAIHLELAQRLLQEGGSPGDIWAACGFSCRADLTRRMRLATGLSPRRWARRTNAAD